MPSIWDVAKAVRASGLSASARHIMQTLAFLADVETAVVPEEYGPSLNELAKATALGRSTVARELAVLEKFGWVVRKRPPVAKARAEKAKTRYALTVGTSPTTGLVPQRDQSTSPTAGLDKAVTSPTQGLALVPQRDGASPTAGHSTDRTDLTDPSSSTKKDAGKPRRSRPSKGRPTKKDVNPVVETVEQRVNRLARVYTDRVPLSNFVAVRTVVKKAVTAGVTDELITGGLEKLAADNRAVTADSLRYAIYGVPPSQFKQAANGTRRHRAWQPPSPDDDDKY